eukprot:CAMPEP_0177594718 /NCGR_PEP_ID=MMETSP0419_2-20121207/9935_1 /TAXON_ID=582737 /ORGANISM="Tetraselmis sp., Strain GSL018" /LENGTH=848 /DNA_ID=CAMNT_0019086055 /DNA_START=526 /DNA_END=3073 /DNA_ORIENTATION=+
MWNEHGGQRPPKYRLPRDSSAADVSVGVEEETEEADCTRRFKTQVNTAAAEALEESASDTGLSNKPNMLRKSSETPSRGFRKPEQGESLLRQTEALRSTEDAGPEAAPGSAQGSQPEKAVNSEEHDRKQNSSPAAGDRDSESFRETGKQDKDKAFSSRLGSIPASATAETTQKPSESGSEQVDGRYQGKFNSSPAMAPLSLPTNASAAQKTALLPLGRTEDNKNIGRATTGLDMAQKSSLRHGGAIGLSQNGERESSVYVDGQRREHASSLAHASWRGGNAVWPHNIYPLPFLQHEQEAAAHLHGGWHGLASGRHLPKEGEVNREAVGEDNGGRAASGFKRPAGGAAELTAQAPKLPRLAPPQYFAPPTADYAHRMLEAPAQFERYMLGRAGGMVLPPGFMGVGPPQPMEPMSAAGRSAPPFKNPRGRPRGSRGRGRKRGGRQGAHTGDRERRESDVDATEARPSNAQGGSLQVARAACRSLPSAYLCNPLVIIAFAALARQAAVRELSSKQRERAAIKNVKAAFPQVSTQEALEGLSHGPRDPSDMPAEQAAAGPTDIWQQLAEEKKRRESAEKECRRAQKALADIRAQMGDPKDRQAAGARDEEQPVHWDSDPRSQQLQAALRDEKARRQSAEAVVGDADAAFREVERRLQEAHSARDAAVMRLMQAEELFALERRAWDADSLELETAARNAHAEAAIVRHSLREAEARIAVLRDDLANEVSLKEQAMGIITHRAMLDAHDNGEAPAFPAMRNPTGGRAPAVHPYDAFLPYYMQGTRPKAGSTAAPVLPFPLAGADLSRPRHSPARVTQASGTINRPHNPTARARRSRDSDDSREQILISAGTVEQ